MRKIRRLDVESVHHGQEARLFHHFKNACSHQAPSKRWLDGRNFPFDQHEVRGSLVRSKRNWQVSIKYFHTAAFQLRQPWRAKSDLSARFSKRSRELSGSTF